MVNVNISGSGRRTVNTGSSSTDWKEDLLRLLADSAPAQALQNEPLQAAAGRTFEILGLPGAGVREGIGQARLLIEGQGLHDPRAGVGRARLDEAWREFNENPNTPGLLKRPAMAAFELATDPLTFTGIGAAGKVAQGARGMAALRAAEHPLQAAGLRGAARGLEVAQAVNDVPGRLALEGVQVPPTIAGRSLPGPIVGRQLPGIQAGVRQFGRGIQKVRPGSLDLSPKGLLRREVDEVHNTLNDRRASGVSWTGRGGAFDAFNTGLRSAYPEHPGLLPQQNDLLNRSLADGTTYGAFLDKTAIRASLDKSQLEQAGVVWKANANLDARLKTVKGLPNEGELTKIIRDWNDKGIDLLYAQHPDDVATVLLERTLAKERGLKVERSTVGALFRAAFGEQALLTPKYHTGNIQGSWLMNAVRGSFQSLNPRDYEASYKVARGGLDKTTYDEALASLKSTQVARFWGMDRPDVEVLRGGVRAMTGNDSRISPSAMGELTGRLTRSERLGELVGRPFTFNNNLSLGVDYMGRGAIWSDVLDREMKAALPAWESEVRRRASGIPGFEFDVLGGVNAPPSLAFKPLKDHLGSLGLAAGDAERLARDFVEARGKARVAAKTQMEQVQFSYARTNLDEWVANFVPFHYWYSRALRFYGEESLRNPYLILNYMRANDGIEDAQNDPGLSARQKGFIRLFGTPLGFSLLMNPDALFGVVKVFGMDQQEAFDPDPNAKWHDPPTGMTPMGGVIDWLKQRGMGLYPWLDGSMNMLGMYGNSFEPDLLGIRHRALVGSAINFAAAHTGAQPPGAPYAQAMGQARWALSSAAEAFLPDWLAQPVAPKAGGSTQEAALDTIIENIVIARNQGLTGQDLLEIMSDPESPEYEDAYRVASEAGVVQQLLNFVVPQRFTMRHDARDVQTAQQSLIFEQAKKTGQNPYQFAPRPHDLEFAARYEKLTGKPWKPGDYETAKVRHDLSRAPDETAKRFIVDEAAYQKLGNPTQRAQWKMYNALLWGDDPRTKGLPPEARRQAAQTYLDHAPNARTNIDSIYAMRNAFELSHPEFGAFKDWEGKMRDLKEQYGGSLAEYRRQASAQNPNAARYFADKRAYWLRNDPEKLEERLEQDTISAAAFLAITGQPELRSREGPLPGVPPADVTLPGMLPAAQPAQPYNPQVNWMQQLAYYGQNQGLERPRW